MRGSTQSDRSGLFHGVVNTHPEARLRFGVGLCVLFLIADGSDRVVLQQPVFGHCRHWPLLLSTSATRGFTDADRNFRVNGSSSGVPMMVDT